MVLFFSLQQFRYGHFKYVGVSEAASMTASYLWYSPVPLAQPCTHRTGYMYIKEQADMDLSFPFILIVAADGVGSNNGIESLTREFGSSSY